MKDYYAILGISTDAEPEVISAAYKALAKKYHPDVYKGSKKDSENRIREINEAYSNLSNKQKKDAYDKEFLKNKPTGSFDDFNNSDFDDNSNVFDNDWNILIEVFPQAEKRRENLSKLSQKLSFLFQAVLLEKQLGNKSEQVARNLRNDFLERYFGKNRSIQELAAKALMNNEIGIAKEINKKITLLGNDAANKILNSVSSKLNEKLNRKKTKTSHNPQKHPQPPKYKKTQAGSFVNIIFILAIGFLFSFIVVVMLM